MCITPHSAMDNTIHSIWKSKSSFPTSCKQCCPQLHKTGSYTHCPQIQTYIKSKLFWKWLDNRGFLQKKVWISFHQMQCSNYNKVRKTLLFISVPTNLFTFLTRENQNKIQKFRFSHNAGCGGTPLFPSYLFIKSEKFLADKTVFM